MNKIFRYFNAYKEQKKLELAYLKELNWANIYHDSIRGKKEIEALSLNIGRWAGNYAFFYVLHTILSKGKPTNVLELGLGESTKFISTYLKNYLPQTSHIVIEHDESWISFFNSSFELNSNSKIDFQKFPTYTTFTFDKSKNYNRFNETAIPYELTENDLRIIDSILPICMNQTDHFKGLRNLNNYSKQCIAIKNKQSEIEVWIKCACSGIAKETFKYFISNTYDGGHCFFNLKINLAKKECFDIAVNSY